jgi:IclR family transcriptional regulator, KDG regulon repressor
MTKREKSNYMIQSVSHALDVLEELAKSRGEVGVTELSKRLDLHKNNVFRLLATLELRGYVEQNRDSENYCLGVKSLELGQSYLIQSTMVERATPVLKRLCEHSGETISLAVLHNGKEVQFPLCFESRRPVKCAPRIAVSFPAKQNAAGRLLLAQLADSELEELLAANTPQDAAIRNQLADLRGSGLIIDRGAIESDVVSIAKIIRSASNIPVAAIEITAPQYRVDIDKLVNAIEEASEKLSQTLGHFKSTLASGIEIEVDREDDIRRI